MRVISIESISMRTGMSPYLFGGKERDEMLGIYLMNFEARSLDDFGRFTTVDPQAEKYYSMSPYSAFGGNPIKYTDKDGKKLKLSTTAASVIENVAKIAATNFGSTVLGSIINNANTYNFESVFWSFSSTFDADERIISAVGSPWMPTVNGGKLTSLTAMGHEMYHAYEHTSAQFSNSDYQQHSDYRRGLDIRATNFENYLRSVYSITPYRKSYGSTSEGIIQGGNSEKISNFTTLGHNSDKTSYGFSYTKTTEKVISRNIYGVPTETSTEATNYYMIVSMDDDINVTYKVYNNQDEYSNATRNW